MVKSDSGATFKIPPKPPFYDGTQEQWEAHVKSQLTPDPEYKPSMTEEKKSTLSVPQVEDLKIDTWGWKKTGGKLGSNAGGTFEAPDGSTYYVKTPKTEDHAKQEVLANAFYRALGVDVPDVKRDGKMVASKLIDGKPVNSLMTKGKAKAQLQENFAADVLLANWDVGGVGWSNVLMNSDGKVVRVDAGGALMYRAQGAPKGSDFNGDASEFETLRDKYKNPTGAQIFGSMNNAQVKASAKKLQDSIDHAGIDALVKSVYPEGHPELSNTLKKRYDSIVKKANALPNDGAVYTPNTPDPMTLNSPVFPKGKTGQVQMQYAEAYYKGPDAAAAFDQLPDDQKKQIDAMGGNAKVQEKFASTDWALSGNTPKYESASQEAQKSLKAYTSSSYGPINKALRSGKVEGLDPAYQEDIKKMTQALNESASDKDLLLVRGIDKSEDVFKMLGLGKPYGQTATIEALRSRIGTTFVDEGFISTAYQNPSQQSGKAGFVGSSKINLRILAPKGTKMMNIKPISNYQSENEVLMQKGTQLTISGAYRDDKSNLIWVDVIAEN